MAEQARPRSPDTSGSAGRSLRENAFACGAALAASGRPRNAIAEFEQALGEHGATPSTARILAELASAYAQAGDREPAFRTFLQCAEIDPENGASFLERAARILDYQTADSVQAWIEQRYGPDARLSMILGPQLHVGMLLLFGVVARILKQPQRAFDFTIHATRYKGGAAVAGRAAQQLYEIASALSFPTDLDFAEQVLRAAISLDPSHTLSWVLLSDVLRRKSYTPEQPFVAPELIRESLAAWETAESRRSAPDAWSLMTRALINEQLARLPGAKPWDLWWEAVVLIHRAMALSTPDCYHYSNLGRAFRELQLYTCENFFTKRALETADYRAAFLEERIITTANAGLWNELGELIREKRQIDPSKWLDAVEGFAASRTGEPEKGLELIDRSLDEFGGHIWCRHARARCFLALGRISELTAEYEQILAMTDPADPRTMLDHAEARFWLGLIQGSTAQAEQLFRTYRDNHSTPTEDEPFLGLARCRLAAGDPPSAAEYLHSALARCTRQGRLQEYRQLLQAAAALRSNLGSSDYAGTLNQSGALDQIAARRAHLAAHPLTPQREILDLLATGHPEPAAGPFWCGAHATLATLYQAEDSETAVISEAGQLLSNTPRQFPEARMLLEQSCAREKAAADALLRSGDLSAKARYEQINRLRPYLPGSLVGDTLCGLSLISIAEGRKEESLAHLTGSLSAYGAGRGPGLAAERFLELITNSAALWTVWELFAAAGLDPAALLAYFTDRGTEERYTERKRITLELGQGLIPEDTSPNWALFRTYIPSMRERVKNQWGVTLPGINVRGNYALQANEYAMLLHDIPLPLEQGSVELEAAYSLAPRERLLAAGVAAENLIAATDPVARATGHWVAGQDWNKVKQAGLPIDDEPLVFIMRHLEAVLVRHLDELLNLDDVEYLLDSIQDESAKATIAAGLSSPRSRFEFARFLRELLREQAPITQLAEIVSATRTARLDAAALDLTILRVRQVLRKQLPGNAGEWMRVRLPESLENRARQAMTRAPGSELASLEFDREFRQFIDAESARADKLPIAVIVEDYAAGRWLRNEIRHHIANTAILWKDEVVEQAAKAASGSSGTPTATPVSESPAVAQGAPKQ